MNLFTSREFSPSALDEITPAEFASMQERYGGWLGAERRASKETVRVKIQDIPITYFSVADQELPSVPQFLDGDRVEASYLTGWRERVDIDELWFLSTHSSVLARIKKREKDLAVATSRLLRSGLRAGHLTMQHTTRADRNATLDERGELRRLAQAGRWLIWLLTGAAALSVIPTIVPWAVSGPIILSFEI